jgi:hypothetical protein
MSPVDRLELEILGLKETARAAVVHSKQYSDAFEALRPLAKSYLESPFSSGASHPIAARVCVLLGMLTADGKEVE